MIQEGCKLVSNRLCNQRKALDLSHGVGLVGILIDLCQEKIAELVELLLIQDNGKSTHCVRSALPKTRRCARSKLSVDAAHELVLVDETLLPQDDQPKLFEQVSANVEALFLHLDGSLFNAAVNAGIESLNEADRRCLRGFIDNSAHCQREYV